MKWPILGTPFSRFNRDLAACLSLPQSGRWVFSLCQVSSVFFPHVTKWNLFFGEARTKWFLSHDLNVPKCIVQYWICFFLEPLLRLAFPGVFLRRPDSLQDPGLMGLQITIFIVNTHYKWPCSIAMLVITRGYKLCIPRLPSPNPNSQWTELGN